MAEKTTNAILKRGSKTLVLLTLVTLIIIGGGILLLKKTKNNRPLNQYGTNIYARVLSRRQAGADTSVRQEYADIEYEFKHQVYNESIQDNSQRFAVDDTLILNITPAETTVTGIRKDGQDQFGTEDEEGKLF